MVDAPKPFFTSGEIRALARAALAERSFLWSVPYEQIDELGPRLEAVRAAITYCSAAVAVLDDPELIDLAIELAEAAPWDDLAFPPSETDGLTRLARHRRVEGRLQELVDHERKELRLALAEGVDPSGPRGLSMLQQLTCDPDAQVRARATERLSQVGPLPWWVGKFQDDPFRAMDADARARHEPAVKALGELLGKSFLKPEDYGQMVELTRELPDALAAEALGRALSTERYLGEEIIKPFGVALAHHGEPGRAVMDQHREVGGWSGRRSLAVAYLGALPREARLRCARTWLAELRDRSPARMALEEHELQAQGAISDAVGEHWPDDEDPTEVLEASLARFVPDTWDMAGSGLATALRRSRRDDVLQLRFRAQLLRGFPAPWGGLSRTVLEWFSARTALLPELVEETLSAGAKAGDEALAWALGHRLTTLYDASRDGPLEQLAEALDDRPGLSGPLREHHTPYILGRLRRLLREGRLSADDAARVVKLVGLVRPGVLQGNPMEWTDGRPKGKGLGFPRQWAQNQFGRFFDWPAMKEPVSELEWQHFRHARAKGAMSRWPIQLQLEAFADGPPLAPEDRAYLEKVRAHLRQDPDPVLAGLAIYVFAMCGELSDLEAMVELEEVRDGNGERWCEPAFPHLRQALRERCGVSPKGGKPKLAVVGGKKKPKA